MSKNIIKYYVEAVYVDFVNDDKTIIHTYLGQNCDLFLRSCAPFNKLHDGVSISCIFRKYLKASVIIHKLGDGKTMSGLRRMLATEIITEGTPISTASQVLGHKDKGTIKQYISLDIEGLKKCTLGFDSLEVDLDE